MLDESIRDSDFPTCTICRDNSDARKRWGCDEDVEIPYLEIECVVCSKMDPSCSYCKGKGTVPIYRCPWKLVNRSHFVAVEMCLMFLETGTMPYAGGMFDQPAVFYDAFRIVAKVRGDVHERKRGK